MVKVPGSGSSGSAASGSSAPSGSSAASGGASGGRVPVAGSGGVGGVTGRENRSNTPKENVRPIPKAAPRASSGGSPRVKPGAEGRPSRPVTPKKVETAPKTVKETKNETPRVPPKSPKRRISRRTLLIGGLAGTLAFAGGSDYVYKHDINPKIVTIPDSMSGGVALSQFGAAVNSYNTDLLTSLVNPSYLAMEKSYANGNSARLAFISKVMGTVAYSIPNVPEKDVYGHEVKKNKQPVMIQSPLTDGTHVQLTAIDWSKIDVSPNTVKAYVASQKIKSGAPNYSDLLTNAFAQYITDNKALPTQTIDWSPAMSDYQAPDPSNPKKQLTGAKVDPQEDVNLDNLLFGSAAFLKCITAFSESATGQKASDAWNSYINQPALTGVAPAIGNDSFIQPTFVGAYRLQKGVVDAAHQAGKSAEPVSPPIGDGSKKNPAGTNTPVNSVFFVSGKKGTVTSLPIMVELADFRQGQDAIDFFNTLDSRNQGFTTMSQVQYASMQFKITNMSAKPISISDDSSLVDDQGNTLGRTGTVYGLTSKLNLKPGESGTIQSWVGSTGLQSSFVIWGSSFPKSISPVWFRVLAGSGGVISADAAASAAASASQSPSNGSSGGGTGLVPGSNATPGSSPSDQGTGTPSATSTP